MRVRILTRPELAAGFEMSGLPVNRVDDGAAAAETIKRWLADEDVGIVLVDDELYRAVPRDLLARLDRQAKPLVVPVPGPRWDERSEAEARVLEILRQAIGYRVRAR
jgi:vacuolar-type H+-ATPase subunit F/Vma7